jgi:hypothetical protein
VPAPRLGPFQFERLLGQGGMGRVWRASHEGTGAAVAVKVLSTTQADDPACVAAIEREVRAAARLDHPHVLPVLDYGRVSAEAERDSEGELARGSPWFAMELAPLGSLADRPPRSWPEILRALTALLEALAHAHAQGVLHLDVKPPNLLFGAPRDHLLLADFGLSYVHAAADEGRGVVGTPAYMAPERFGGERGDLGPATDLYSVGCVAYALVCRRRPYEASGFLAMAQAHRTWPLPRLEPKVSVPAGLEPFVRALLQKDPAHRFPCAADALCALAELGEAAPASTDIAALPALHEASPSTETTREPLGELDRATPLDPQALAGSGERAPLRVAPFRTDPGAPAARASLRLAGAGLGLFALRRAPLVDREAERARLWHALHLVRASGGARAVLLEGPSGTGKSRLADWLTERAHELGAAAVWRASHGSPEGPERGLVPMVRRALGCDGLTRDQALSRLLRQAGEEDVADAPALASLVSDAPGRPGTAEERHALILRSLARAARERPVIVLLDDVAPSADSLAFVRHALRTGAPAALFVLTARREDLAARDEERALWEGLAASPSATHLWIDALPEAERPAFLEGLLTLSGDVAARVLERTRGNPLFTVELVGDWVRRGLLVADATGFQVAAGASLALPDDLRAFWSARVEALLQGRPDAEGRALELAALLGRSVKTSEWLVVCAAAGVDAPEGLLDALLRSGLASSEPGSWVWSHAMLHETVELRAERGGRSRRLHDVCAAALRAREGVAPERLGRHLCLAGKPVQAIDPLLLGLDHRLASGELGLAGTIADLLDAALEAARLPEADARRARAEILIARLERLRGRVEVAAARAAAARRLAASAGAHLLEIEALAEGAAIEYRAGNLDHAAALGAQGARLAQGLERPSLAARCREIEARVLTDRGHLAEASEAWEHARAGHAAAGEARGEAMAQLGSGWVALARGDLERARALVAHALETLEALGARVEAATAANMLGEVARARGDREQAEAFYAMARARHRAAGSLEGAVIAELNLALMQLDAGAYARARVAAEELLRRLLASGARQFVAAASLLVAACVAAEGEGAAAREALERAEAALDASGQVHADLALLAEKTALLADEAGLSAIAARARALAGAQGARLEAGPASRGAARE